MRARLGGTAIRGSLRSQRESQFCRELVADPVAGSQRINLRLEVEVCLSKIITSPNGDRALLSPDVQLQLSRDGATLREASVPL